MNESKLQAAEIIKMLKLVPLAQEGGFFRRTYESSQPIDVEGMGKRAAITAIYYLVTPEDYSALHRVKSDEIFHFCAGDPVEMIQITEDGALSLHKLGSDFLRGQNPQVVVERGVWQGLRLVRGGSWALMGCTVAPGFEYKDFELGERDALLAEFPEHREAILGLTRNEGRD
ncbi:MAG: cupin domain-containing protein [Bdellovibrionota bacterium]